MLLVKIKPFERRLEEMRENVFLSSSKCEMEAIVIRVHMFA